MVLITQATSEGSGKPEHLRSLARAFTVGTHEVWKQTMGPTKNRTSSPNGLLCIRIWRMSIRRTKSAIISWTGSFNEIHARQGKIWIQKPCYRIIMITYFCLLWQESWLYLHAIYEKSLIPHEGSYEMKKRTISSAYQIPPPSDGQ